MQSLWIEQDVLIDAESVSLLAPGVAAADRILCRHHGDPASVTAALLAGRPQPRPHWRNRLNVWLGYPWFHAQVLPWQPGLPAGDSHWRAYALALLRERGVTGPLRISLGAARYGHARLAFAADAAMLDALERQTSEKGWRVGRCQDVLSASLQRYHRQLHTPGQCLVLAEPAAMTCLWQSEAGWEDMITLQRTSDQRAGDSIAAAEALCGRAPVTDYAWASTVGPRQLPLAPQARWLGFPHSILVDRSCPA